MRAIVQSTEPLTVISLIGDEVEVIRQGRGVLPGVENFRRREL